ncbi:phosphatase PAP2 family protein [Hoeflea sp. AS60]|uniref:phosphatase PAP2 family protein n=1 Tax=Hoeflea sp. AS60 TaxID=3135780 RepID=UPI00316F4F39
MTKALMAHRKFQRRYWDAEARVTLGMTRFLENSAWKETEIPLPPTTEDVIQAEIDELLAKQFNHTDREARRHDIMEERFEVSPKFKRCLLFSAASHPRTCEIVTAMVITGRPIIFYFKDRFNRARPSQMFAEIEPMIDVPGHPAYPSGHSFQSHLIAHALSDMAPLAREHMFAIAASVAENREWAGLHYRSDSQEGRNLAHRLFPEIRSAFSELFEEARSEWV